MMPFMAIFWPYERRIHLSLNPTVTFLRTMDFQDWQGEGGTTQATNIGVLQPDIDWVNCWNTGGEEIVDAPMHVIYVDLGQILSSPPTN